MPKLRQNIVTGDWVVISPERSKRPEDYITEASPKHGIPDDCPFCVSKNNAYRFSIKEAETDNIYVIPNKYPAFSKEDALVLEGNEFYNDTKSVGGHEVIILKDHEQDIYDDGQAIVSELIGVYKHRLNFYEQDPAVQYSMIIHNHGPEAAASIDHPHSQLFASPIVPSYVEKEILGSKKYFEENQRCVFCDINKTEKGSNRRIIYENSSFLVYTFFAARFPFEYWIVPKAHLARFEKIDARLQEDLADAMHAAMGKLNKALNYPPFNYWIHTLSQRAAEGDEHYHWHLEVAPRVSKFGGYEMGSGMVIDVVSPEVAANFLKNA